MSEVAGNSSQPKDPRLSAPAFEDSLAELEDVVAQLEAGVKPLDESLALYEKGVAALKRCHVILDTAEKRIRVLVKNAGGEAVLRETSVESFQVQAAQPRESGAKLTAPQKKKNSGNQNVDSGAPCPQNLQTSENRKAPPAAPKSGEHAGSDTGGPLFAGTQ